MSKKLNWGIVGCGAIAGSHGSAMYHLTKGGLYAVCDVIPERADAFATKYGAEKVYYHYRDMLQDSSLDAISICTPSGMHGQMCLDAIEAGKHIMCEKPMEITKEKMQLVIERLAKSNVKMGCVFQRRFEQKFAVTREALKSGRFGKIILAEAYLKYNRDQSYYNSDSWRGTWALDGGGALMNQGVHGVDLLLWLTGEAESVFAHCATQVRDIEVEDTAVASVKFKNGALGVIVGTTSIYPAQETRLEIHCEKGSIIVSDSGILEWKLEDSGEEAPLIKEAKFGVKDDPGKLPTTSHLPVLEDMSEAILYDRSPAVTPADARGAVELILAIYQSARQGREISLS